MSEQELRDYVGGFLAERERYLRATQAHGSPLYLIDLDVLRRQAHRFTETFAAVIERPRVFYALKSNTHPQVVAAMVSAGLGLDVSSGRELRQALRAKAESIIFSGPGKTDEELGLALQHNRRVSVLIDSFGELERLGNLAARVGSSIRAGVRLSGDDHGLWRKFGIPLACWGDFWQAASRISGVRLDGIQFHSSWNLDPSRQVAFLARIGEALKSFPAARRQELAFIDVGGGYWPSEGEWLQSADGAAVPPTGGPSTRRIHYKRPAAGLETFANHFAQALQRHILPLCAPEIWLEPGRWLCHPGMHLLLRVVDRKAEDLVITDAGTNAVGWERFESDYFPVINLSQPSLAERACHVLGSLCTPHDVWGYGYWGAGIATGDVLLIPAQGAYTYSLRQAFIKPLPRSAVLASER